MAPVIDDRAARLRAMSAKDAVAHLIKVANGAGEGVFHDEEGNFQRVRSLIVADANLLSETTKAAPDRIVVRVD